MIAVRKLALLLALVIAAALGAGAAPAAAELPTPLDHAGRWFTGTDGRVAVLRGLNMVYKRPPYAPDAIGFGEDDAEFLASEGFNTVRLGLIYKAIEPQPGVYDDAYLARIQDTVDTLGKHGIVSLLDFHQDLYNERFQGEGWPDWAVQDDGLPAMPQAGFPGNYLVMPALQHAFDHFWANDPGPGGVGIQDRYAAAWRHVAERFRDNPNVLGYDLLNEPWPGTRWQECANPAGCPAFDAKLSAFNDRMVEAIRKADRDTLVLYEPNVLFNNGARTNLRDTGDDHAGMSFHDYCLTAGEGGGGYEGCEEFDSLVFQNADDHSAATGDALILTEFGATDTTAVLRGVLELADRHMTSWQEWHYCGCDDPTTTGAGDKQAVVLDPAKPPRGDNVKASTLAELTRPYPRLVAGTPESWSFDFESRRFDFTYKTKRAGGDGAFAAGAETEVAVPKRRYTDGYAASVQGGSIKSAPGDPLLRVSACPGVERVAVKVTPDGSNAATCKPPPKPKLRVAVAPRSVRAGGRRHRFRVTVRTGRGAAAHRVRGARVTFVGKRKVTGRRGRAVFRRRFTKPGRRVVRARAAGYRSGRAVLRVKRRRPHGR